MISLKKNSSQQGREAGQLKRNILATLTLASGLLFFSGGVSAANELTLTQVAGGLGGPFQVTNILGGQLEGQEDFITFCVEQSETVISGNKYEYDLSTEVKFRGSESTATLLKSGTAQLYSMFRDGSLANAGLGFVTDNTEHQKQLQNAIWFIEESSPTLAAGSMAEKLFDYVDPNQPPSTAWTLGLGNVRVINLTFNGANKQSQLAVVPIPAAAWLFGSGLIGLAAITRKKKAA